jgi:hypothetical protein
MKFKNKIFTFILLLSFIACSKISEIKIDPVSDYLIVGKIENTKSNLKIFDLKSGDFNLVRGAVIYLMTDGQQNNLFTEEGDGYVTRSYLRPGSEYDLHVILGEEVFSYSSVLPDSVDQALLSLHKKNDFDYFFNLRIDQEIGDTNVGYFWENERFIFPKSLSDDFYYKELDFANRSHENFKLQNVCTSPVEMNETYSFRFQRINSRYLEFLKYQEEVRVNKNNVLFMPYSSSADVQINNALFRVFNVTNIQTNIISTSDETSAVFRIFIYDQNGLPLEESILEKGRVGFYSVENNSAVAGLEISSKNPTVITKSKLAKLVNSQCSGNTVIENLLNQNLEIGVTLAGHKSSFATEVITNFNVTKDVKFRLKKE